MNSRSISILSLSNVGTPTAAMVKRRGLKPPPPPPPLSSTPPPQPPSTPPLKVTANPTTTAGTKARRSLAPTLLADGWIPLHVPRSELSLPLTLPTGQTFRWRCTTAGQYTGVVGPHLLSLKHLDDGGEIAFLLHDPTADAPAAAAAALRDYLNLGISIANMWEKFSDADLRFAELALGFEGGARVLRQDPVECVLQFLCSSNNNIGRIEKMVGVLSSFGKHLGTVGGFDFHEFPTLDRLSLVSELQLREAGFGYRAKYIVGAVQALRTKPGGGSQWLASLRALKLPEVIDALCTLPGIGPKVSACIALFSLDKHHAIPVDTHVWQIATRYLLPELAGMHPTPQLCGRVAEAFFARFGEYAGWAQTVLFIGELPSQKALRQSADVSAVREAKSAKRKHKRSRVAVELLTQNSE